MFSFICFFQSNNDYKKANPVKSTGTISGSYKLSKKKLNFKSQLDIRGKRAEEALTEVKKFIEFYCEVIENEIRKKNKEMSKGDYHSSSSINGMAVSAKNM